MNVSVIGADGQLGIDVVKAFTENGDKVTRIFHADMELADRASVSERLNDLRADLIVNTAAMHHVEKCEQDPEKALAVNGSGVLNLALAAKRIGATLMHVSTDYVFDGSKTSPYKESDAPRPLNVYGNTKLAGEYFVRATTDKHFVLRTSAIYGKNPCRAKGGLNFVELMLKLARERGEVKVVDDEIVSPTPTPEIARQMVVLSRSEQYGLYHTTAEGSCSWHAFAAEIFRIANTNVTLKVAAQGEFPIKVPRPKYSVLENCELKKHGLNIFRPWQEGLREYFSVRSSN